MTDVGKNAICMQQRSFVQVTAKFQLKCSVKGTERRPVCTQKCKILNTNTNACASDSKTPIEKHQAVQKSLECAHYKCG